MGFRRVITSHDANGRSVFSQDEYVASREVGTFQYDMYWNGDDVPTVPNDGRIPEEYVFFPPPGGVRIFAYSLPPEDEVPMSELSSGEIAQTLAPGVIESAETGMHTTDTVDVVIVLDGEVCLTVDDGAEVKLGAGDVVIQNGTRHAWRNKSSRPVKHIVLVMGAHRVH
jgi:mannose-6-phosphate isomerase-like protein (cupin superfamily)